MKSRKEQNDGTSHNTNVGNIENTCTKRSNADIYKIHNGTIVHYAINRVANATGNK